MKTLQILMNKHMVEAVLDWTEEHFRPMVRYIKRYYDEEDYQYLSVLVVEYPDNISRDVFDGSILFIKGDTESSNPDIREEWGIRMLGIPHGVERLVLDYDNAMKGKQQKNY